MKGLAHTLLLFCLALLGICVIQAEPMQSASSAKDYFLLAQEALHKQERGKALLYLRKAERKWSFFNRQPLHNAIQKAQTNPQYPHVGKDIKAIVSRYSNDFIIRWPLWLLQIIFLFLWSLVFVFIRHIYETQRKWIFITICLFTVFFGLLMGMRYSIEVRKYAVVLSPQAFVYSGPDVLYHKIFSLHEAHEVVVLKEAHNFAKIRWGKLSGWIEKKDIGVV